MNPEPQAQTTMPLPGIPLVKNETVKDDGRFLIYYTFPQDGAAPPREQTEDAHV